MASVNNKNLLLGSTDDKEVFWLEDITMLYSNNRYLKFVPQYRMTRVQQLNAATRFSIYLFILLIIFGKTDEWLYVPLVLLLVIMLIYVFNKYDKNAKNKELNKILSIRENDNSIEKEEFRKEFAHDGDDLSDMSNPEIDGIDFNIKEDEKKDYELESGYYDSDGKLRMGVKEQMDKFYVKDDKYSKLSKSLYTVDEVLDYEKNTCRKPTKDNPFMNPDYTQFTAGDQPAACNADDNEIKDSIAVNFNHELFRDVDELWERGNSQRQFYTLPNTSIPNNQTEFAKWLYGGTSQVCKSDQSACLRYEDIRFQRR